jgi:hypothetical protein
MRRPISLGVAVALMTAACSAAGPPAANPTTSGPASTTVPSVSLSAPDDTTTTVADSPATTSDRPPAPDFTLALGDGGSFTLSEEARPVFLVFWAEW